VPKLPRGKCGGVRRDVAERASVSILKAFVLGEAACLQMVELAETTP